jgi:hypothetical protein
MHTLYRISSCRYYHPPLQYCCSGSTSLCSTLRITLSELLYVYILIKLPFLLWPGDRVWRIVPRSVESWCCPLGQGAWEAGRRSCAGSIMTTPSISYSLFGDDIIMIFRCTSTLSSKLSNEDARSRKLLDDISNEFYRINNRITELTVV